ncbi:hypothetical protein H4N54_24540 [Limnospira fusiformis KN01]|uniref:Uncharacterized protein n=3 Tax=Limnospira TaxID=2596745 RepID=A0A9P1P1V0_9CYAN|nr:MULTISPECIES: hypothetical protein [Limnospira]EKD08634.1 hypothetical protein SPLC1_S200340 [Arthrospira platensis C1]MBD2572701.1 hypothetical protein [Arthrospira platensis FACHB-971]MDC0837316.1 hypothetical protein [Limnoraphis robusta]MDT9188677.1 hypothetical protein [Limnospira sp. PMC 894.15]MDY7054261.1 hypothetical protein [Limnospira fusiformis LS22]QJB29119.1 hypothetical protein HFV01_29040 [Limnospira fusiformis SAG 85.79]CDM98387.1 hypothetical protein ARTHRO_60988 [Limnos
MNLKLSDYTKKLGVSYPTPGRCWKSKQLPHPTKQTVTRRIMIDFHPHSLAPSAKIVRQFVPWLHQRQNLVI